MPFASEYEPSGLGSVGRTCEHVCSYTRMLNAPCVSDPYT